MAAITKSKYTLAVLVTAGVGVLIWRRQHPHLPCPAALSFLLENPVMNRMAGAKALLDRADVSSSMRVLDIGCGPGRITLPAAHRVGPTGEVVALDIQKAMLRRVQKKLDAQNMSNVSLLHAGAGEGKTEPSSFDRAFMVTVLGEIPDKVAALREAFRALKPGGILSITEVIYDPDYQTPNVVRRLAQETGFEVGSKIGSFFAYTMNLVKPV